MSERPLPHANKDSVNRGLYVLMGVAGAGKSVIGSALASALGFEFVEGDAYHPAENVRRMAAGTPLTDADRLGWLMALATRLREAQDAGTGLVMSCSALKRSYRDVLREGAGKVRLIYLRGERELLAERLAGRTGHFMPPALLDSQLAALQDPAPDEAAWVCDIGQDPRDIVAELVARVVTLPPESP